MALRRSSFNLLLIIIVFGTLKILKSCANMSDFFHDPPARILMTLGYSWEAIMFKQNGIFSQNQLESNPNWLLGPMTMGKLIQLPKPLSHTHKLGLLTTGWLWRLTSVIQHVFTLWTGHRAFHKGMHWWPVSILKAQGAHRLQTHSFPEECILSTHNWSAFANGHTYSVTASKCTGDNMANCSLWWLTRCSETEWVRARGSCETLRSESLQRRRRRALMFTSALKLHTHVSVHCSAERHLDTSYLSETTQLKPPHLLRPLLPTESPAIPYQDQLKCHILSKAFPDDPSQHKWLSSLPPPTKHYKPIDFLFMHT